MGCYAAWFRSHLATFRDSFSVPSFRVMLPKDKKYFPPPPPFLFLLGMLDPRNPRRAKPSCNFFDNVKFGAFSLRKMSYFRSQLRLYGEVYFSFALGLHTFPPSIHSICPPGSNSVNLTLEAARLFLSAALFFCHGARTEEKTN